MTKGILGPLDAYLDFGEVTLTSSPQTFPNVIDMGTSNADHLEVVANVSMDATGGTDCELVLKGSNDNHSFEVMSTGPKIAAAKIKAGEILRVAIPRHTGYRYLQVVANTSGSFSAGKLHAWLDTYDAK